MCNDETEPGGAGSGGGHRQKLFPPSPLCSNPFLPQAGAGHFVQIPVYTPVPMQRSRGAATVTSGF